MTNEELIEEILIKAHNLGIRKDVINGISKLMDDDKQLSFYDAIINSYYIEKNKLRKNDLQIN